MDRGWQPVRSWQQVLCILLVVVAGYVFAPARLPLSGEETCRALHGIEMAASGDWLVPTNQGKPILDRPPLQYWLLAVIHAGLHPLDPTTLRMVAAAITALTSLLVWACARQFLGPVGACAAGCAFPTMGHVSDLGRRIETDGLFSMLLGGALLVWYAGRASGRAPWRYWLAGGALAGLAALAKGTQAPLAFFGATFGFLLLRRDWRMLRGPAPLFGIAAFVAVVAIWQVPFWLREGWVGTRMTWFDPGAERYGAGAWRWLTHFFEFPLELLGATQPWSLLLLALSHRSLWGAGPAQRAALQYFSLASAAILAPVWLTAHGAPRHAMPAYPMLAVLAGIVVERSLAAAPASGLGRLWLAWRSGLSWLLLGAAMALAAVTQWPEGLGHPRAVELAQPGWLLLLLALLAAFALRLARSRGLPGLLAVSLLLATWLNGPAVNTIAASAERVGPQIAEFRAGLAPSERLVSFGLLHHKFLYFMAQPVPSLSWPRRPDELPEEVTLFAFHAQRSGSYDLPFAWAEVARFNMDRRRKQDPDEVVVVGRRLGPANGAGK